MEEETEITIKEARQLAKYYGKMLMSNWNQNDAEALSYCRWIILKRRIKK